VLPLYKKAARGPESMLRIGYPKRSGNEVRLYFSNGGFSPRVGDVWFIFVRSDGKLCVGWHNKTKFSLLGSGPTGPLLEDSDEDFQTRIEIAIAGSVPTRRLAVSGYRRNVRYALEALESAGFQCELDPSHSSFISARTRKPYMEAHHIVPVSAVRDFPLSILDVARNIASLCPNCHRRIHFAAQKDRFELVRKLIARRKNLLSFLKIPEANALAFYRGAGPVPDA